MFFLDAAAVEKIIVRFATYEPIREKRFASARSVF
jgi:hypothetical protein